MKKMLTALAALALAIPLSGAVLAAEPEYVTTQVEIDVAKPAKEVWAKVGKYCDISAWLNLDCKITSGDGGIGTVRVLAGGRVTEILVGQTELSYGYTQPAKEGAVLRSLSRLHGSAPCHGHHLEDHLHADV